MIKATASRSSSATMMCRGTWCTGEPIVNLGPRRHRGMAGSGGRATPDNLLDLHDERTGAASQAKGPGNAPGPSHPSCQEFRRLTGHLICKSGDVRGTVTGVTWTSLLQTGGSELVQ